MINMPCQVYSMSHIVLILHREVINQFPIGTCEIESFDNTMIMGYDAKGQYFWDIFFKKKTNFDE